MAGSDLAWSVREEDRSCAFTTGERGTRGSRRGNQTLSLNDGNQIVGISIDSRIIFRNRQNIMLD